MDFVSKASDVVNVFSVPVPSGLSLEILSKKDLPGTFFVLKKLGGSISTEVSFFNGSKDFNYFVEPRVFEGCGGSLFFLGKDSSSSIALSCEERRLNTIISGKQYVYTTSLSLTGSGFRARCVSDSKFQQGVFLELQLGSKGSVLRVPYTAVSLNIREGRFISVSSYDKQTLKNWSAFLQGLSPFCDGKGIAVSSLYISFTF